MPASSQTVIGDCGHVCVVWPQSDEVLCDVCVKAAYGIPDDESVGVWVRVKIVKTRAPRKTAPKKVDVWEQLMDFIPGTSDSSGET